MIPSFLVTLGTLSAARGLAMMVTDTKPVIITNERYFRIFGEGAVFGLPARIAWTLAATVGGVLMLHYNIFGRRIYAAGGNPTAALDSGIQIKRVTTWAFVLTGALAGLAALILGCSHAARPDVVQGMELDDRLRHPRRMQPVRRARVHPRHAAWQPHHRHAQQRTGPAWRLLADATRDQGDDYRRRCRLHKTLACFAAGSREACHRIPSNDDDFEERQGE